MIKDLTGSERAILEYFITRPDEEIHVRGLSQELDMPYATVRKGLKSLEEKGLLNCDKRSKMSFYSRGGEKFLEAKKIINLEILRDSGLVEHLEKQLRPDALVLFGSFLEGRDNNNSDIDIAVVNGRETEIDLRKFEEELKRDIHLVEIGKAKDENENFKNTLANGYVLQGYLELV